MTGTQSQGHPLALLYADALDALGPRETALLERHLDRCTACRTETDELRAVTSELTLVGPPAPPELRDRIVAAIRPTR